MTKQKTMRKIAILGRPNVGKSTLFNRLIHSNRAITHDMPGVTRDRMEGICRPDAKPAFIVIDTGGITPDQHAKATEGPKASRGFEEAILAQAKDALSDADAVCLVMDGREGLTPQDEYVAAYARRCGKPILLAVNKIDGMEREDALLAEFHALGFDMLGVSAEHGHNLRLLTESLAKLLPETGDGAENPVPDEEPARDDNPSTGRDTPADEHTAQQKPIKIAVLGRPNAGKSSLINALIGENRMIVSDIAGTTRDSVDIPFTAEDGTQCVFVDTAGIRRRTKIDSSVERFAVNASIKSTTKADITLYVVDVTEGITAQDKRLLELLDERKEPFIIIVNKSDLMRRDERKETELNFKEWLEFCPHIPVLYVSARKKTGLNTIIPMAKKVLDECSVRIGTSKLNDAMQTVLERHQPPIVKNARPKFFYLTQAETQPPTFVFFVSDADRVSDSYTRYLEKNLRNIFGIRHAPMRLHLRSSHGKNAKGKN